MKTILIYLAITTLAVIGFYYIFQKVLFKAVPWEQYPGEECGPGGRCQIENCRQQNNYWLSQAVTKKDKRLCQKTVACISGDVQTTQFDELDRCQTAYDQASTQ